MTTYTVEICQKWGGIHISRRSRPFPQKTLWSRGAAVKFPVQQRHRAELCRLFWNVAGKGGLLEKIMKTDHQRHRRFTVPANKGANL